MGMTFPSFNLPSGNDCYSLLLKMTIEIVDLPLKMVILHSYICKRLPEGTIWGDQLITVGDSLVIHSPIDDRWSLVLLPVSSKSSAIPSSPENPVLNPVCHGMPGGVSPQISPVCCWYSIVIFPHVFAFISNQMAFEHIQHPSPNNFMLCISIHPFPCQPTTIVTMSWDTGGHPLHCGDLGLLLRLQVPTFRLSRWGGQLTAAGKAWLCLKPI